MSNIQQANVAGSFYPADSKTLATDVEQFLAARHCTEPGNLRAIIAPHAGYIYSADVAAAAYACVASNKSLYRRVAVLSPSHRVAFSGIALSDADYFQTPLGDIKVDKEATTSLVDGDQIGYMHQAYDGEHALEVHFPFLQTALDDFVLIPAIVGQTKSSIVSHFLDKVWDEETLIVISSDLSHFENYQVAKQHDRHTADAIEHLDAQTISGTDACGCYPMNGLLVFAKQKNWQIRQLALANSGDTAGDKSRVVGYGAWGLFD